jgi:hypothetical protein
MLEAGKGAGELDHPPANWAGVSKIPNAASPVFVQLCEQVPVNRRRLMVPDARLIRGGQTGEAGEFSAHSDFDGLFRADDELGGKLSNQRLGIRVAKFNAQERFLPLTPTQLCIANTEAP